MFPCPFLYIIISYPVAVILPIPQQRCLSICKQRRDIVPTTWKKERLRKGSVYLIFYERRLKKNNREYSFSWDWIRQRMQQGATLETCFTHSSRLVYKVKCCFYYSVNVKYSTSYSGALYFFTNLLNSLCKWWWADRLYCFLTLAALRSLTALEVNPKPVLF